MSHTLNEQVLALSKGTMDYDTYSQYIINAIIDLTGWETDESDNTIIYPESSHKFRIKLVHDSGGSSLTWQLYMGSTSIVSPSISLNSNHTVYFHRSKGETVQFFRLDSSWNHTWLFAANEEGKPVFFVGQNGTLSVYNAVSATQGSLSFSSGQTGSAYAISQLPDIWNNSVFPELYFAWAITSPSVENQLISFGENRDVYRLISQITAQYSRLAFPVADM